MRFNKARFHGIALCYVQARPGYTGDTIEGS
jgi:hypothetical protein